MGVQALDQYLTATCQWPQFQCEEPDVDVVAKVDFVDGFSIFTRSDDQSDFNFIESRELTPREKERVASREAAARWSEYPRRMRKKTDTVHDDAHRAKKPSKVVLSDYELDRLRNIERNEQRLRDLGLLSKKKAAAAPSEQKKKSRKSKKDSEPIPEPRVQPSRRAWKPAVVDHHEDDPNHPHHYPEDGIDGKPPARTAAEDSESSAAEDSESSASLVGESDPEVNLEVQEFKDNKAKGPNFCDRRPALGLRGEDEEEDDAKEREGTGVSALDAFRNVDFDRSVTITCSQIEGGDKGDQQNRLRKGTVIWAKGKEVLICEKCEKNPATTFPAPQKSTEHKEGLYSLRFCTECAPEGCLTRPCEAGCGNEAYKNLIKCWICAGMTAKARKNSGIWLYCKRCGGKRFGENANEQSLSGGGGNCATCNLLCQYGTVLPDGSKRLECKEKKFKNESYCYYHKRKQNSENKREKRAYLKATNGIDICKRCEEEFHQPTKGRRNNFCTSCASLCTWFLKSEGDRNLCNSSRYLGNRYCQKHYNKYCTYRRKKRKENK